MEDLIEAYLSVYEDSDIDEGFKRMNRDKIERQAKRLSGDKGDILRDVADRMDTEAERKYSTSQARKNRAGAGSEYRKGKELQARDDAKADFKKYGLPESVDLYDVILNHLLDEGFADTEQNAITIMANMSEAWIDEILDEAKVDDGLSDDEKRTARSERGTVGYMHPLTRKDKKTKGQKPLKSTGKYSQMQHDKEQAQRERDADEQRRRDRGGMSRGTWDRD